MASSRWSRALIALGAGCTLAALVVAPDATARASFDSPYTLDQTFSSALRFVRVDRGYKVSEKDPQSAYVLFEYKEAGDRVSPGAIEMVASGSVVKVVVQLQQMPRYHEQVLADALAKKLRDEYGEPPHKAPPPPPAQDGGADGAAGSSSSSASSP
jgi:hypothetical protein